MVRQGILIPPCGGSNPPAPASQSDFQRISFLGIRKARQMRASLMSTSLQDTNCRTFAARTPDSLRLSIRKLPFFGDWLWRPKNNLLRGGSRSLCAISRVSSRVSSRVARGCQNARGFEIVFVDGLWFASVYASSGISMILGCGLFFERKVTGIERSLKSCRFSQRAH